MSPVRSVTYVSGRSLSLYASIQFYLVYLKNMLTVELLHSTIAAGFRSNRAISNLITDSRRLSRSLSVYVSMATQIA